MSEVTSLSLLFGRLRSSPLYVPRLRAPPFYLAHQFDVPGLFPALKLTDLLRASPFEPLACLQVTNLSLLWEGCEPHHSASSCATCSALPAHRAMLRHIYCSLFTTYYILRTAHTLFTIHFILHTAYHILLNMYTSRSPSPRLRTSSLCI